MASTEQGKAYITNEAAVLEKLTVKNKMECVPRYFESGKIDKFTYLITEYVDESFSQFFNMLDFPQRMTVYA